jgi:type I restriction enzyme S subunit
VSEGPWPVVSLGELIASIEAGASFRCRETPPEADEVGVAKVSAVSWGRYDENESKTCLDASRIETKLLIQKGDFLISRANTVQLVGACVIAERVTKQVMLSDKTLRIQFKDPSLKPWVLHYLRSREGRNQVEALCTGNQESMRNISQKSIRQIQLPLAPAEERDRVIAYLYQQLSRLQASIEIFGTIQAKLKQARASILKAAVEGRLVETEAEIARREKTDYESGGLLLERILYLRENSFRIARQSLNNKIKYPRAFTPSQAKTNVLPEGWAIATIDQLTNYFNGSFIVQGWSPKCLSREAYSSEWCVMKTTAIQPLRFDSGSNKALPQGLDPRPDLELTSGDLLITRAGPRSRVGICCLIEKTRSKVMLCDKAYRIRPSRLCLGKYLEIALNSQSASHSIEQIKTGINDSGVNITQSGFLNLLIPLPPLSEQNRIVDEVDRRFSVLVQVEATVQTSLARCGLLRQAILKRAFGG